MRRCGGARAPRPREPLSEALEEQLAVRVALVSRLRGLAAKGQRRKGRKSQVESKMNQTRKNNWFINLSGVSAPTKIHGCVILLIIAILFHF